MKARIITGAFIVAVTLICLFLFDTVFFTLAICLICGVSVYEVSLATGTRDYKALLILNMVFSMLAPLFGMDIFGVFVLEPIVVIAVYTILLAVVMIWQHSRIALEKMAVNLMLTMVVSFGMGSMIYIRSSTETKGIYPFAGLLYIVLIFVGAWITDAGAYFTGVLFGKHKMSPNISPKKTWEGAAGGLVFCIVFFTVAAYIYKALILKDFGTISYTAVALMAVPVAVVSMIGDLFASTVKRSCGVKDFGKIMPGHGGVLDRFDSILLVAPLMLAMSHYVPMISITIN